MGVNVIADRLSSTPGDGFLAMLDAATGREVRRTPRTDGTNWAAPHVRTHLFRIHE